MKQTGITTCNLYCSNKQTVFVLGVPAEYLEQQSILSDINLQQQVKNWHRIQCI